MATRAFGFGAERFIGTLWLGASLVLSAACTGTELAQASLQGPSFECSSAREGSVEQLICESEELSALDRKLDAVYREAARTVPEDSSASWLKAEQRGWIKGRDECWKSDDVTQCVRDAYVRRTAELQARFGLVPGTDPIRFVCEGNPANEVVVTFFETNPPTLIAERGDQVSVMFLEASASGSKYQGRNEVFWEHQGQASLIWGYGAPTMSCERAPWVN